MAFNVQTEAPPLAEDASGALRIGSSRVLLELVVRAFQDGATPDTIVQRYSTLELADVYAVLAYYLRHPNEVEEYLAPHARRRVSRRARISLKSPNASKRQSKFGNELRVRDAAAAGR